MLKREMEIEQTEKLRFTRMQKMNEHKIKDILKISPDKRDSGQNFYLRMHLQQNVPFFANYSGETLANICNELHQRVYDKGECIFKKGDFGDELYVVMVGEVGVYVDEAL